MTTFRIVSKLMDEHGKKISIVDAETKDEALKNLKNCLCKNYLEIEHVYSITKSKKYNNSEKRILGKKCIIVK